MAKKNDPRRLEIVLYLHDYLAENHYAPTVREIGEAVGCTSSATTWYHLRTLQAAGWVAWESHSVRTLHLTPIGLAVALGIRQTEREGSDATQTTP